MIAGMKYRDSNCLHTMAIWMKTAQIIASDIL
jgi:hypothetical protein